MVSKKFFNKWLFNFSNQKTCFETPWTDIYQTDFISKVIQSYTRDTRLRDRWTDFDYTFIQMIGLFLGLKITF